MRGKITPGHIRGKIFPHCMRGKITPTIVLEATFVFHKDTNGIVSAPEHMDSEIVVLYRINDFTL